jgi:large subunit ribosomal protein L22
MEVVAKAKFIKMAPRKVRLVADMIRGKKAAAALDMLEFSTRWASEPMQKVLRAAIANAEHNFNLKKEDLFIKSVRVDGGPMLKRWAPKAHGRATQIRKHMSHIEIILGEMKKKEKPAEDNKIKIKDEKTKTKNKK